MSQMSKSTLHAALLLVTAAAACSSSSGPRLTGPATIVALTPVATAAAVGTAVSPVPEFVVRDSSGRPLPNAAVAFFTTFGATVTPTSVATDANGIARPSAWFVGTHAGSVSLTAAVASLAATVTVSTQAGPAAHLAVVPSPVAITLSDTVALTAVMTDAFGNPLAPSGVTYASSNNTVVTVSGNRVIPHAVGNALITATLTGTTVSATVPVSVTDHVIVGDRITGFSGRPFGIAYVGGQPGSILVSALDVNNVSFVNASTFSISPTTVGVSVTPSDVFVNQTGTTAYVSAADGSEVAVIDVASRTRTGSIIDAGAARVLLSPDGSKLYVGRNGGLDVFALPGGTKTTSINTGGQVNGLAISGDGSTLYASERFSGKVWRFNTSTMTATDSIATGGAPQDIVLHAASGNVYVANEGGWIDVLTAAHVASVNRFTNTPGAFAMKLSPDGSKLYVSGSQMGQVYVLDRATVSVTRTVNVGGVPRRIAFLPDGRAIVANEAGYVSLVQ
jgi:YVTN family beta-propeller protein